MKKRLINTAFIYGVLGLVAGAFYREFTKFMGFTGFTRLGLVHTHLLVFGMLVFLLAASFAMSIDFTGDKKFRHFFCYYNTGLIITAITLFLRGIYEVLELSNKAFSSAISGVSGVGHVIITVGVVFFFLSLKEKIKDK